jgi:hypothetical protein
MRRPPESRSSGSEEIYPRNNKQLEKSAITGAIAAGSAAGSGTNLATGHPAADIVLGAVGMQRNFWPPGYQQQFGLVGMSTYPRAYLPNRSVKVS